MRIVIKCGGHGDLDLDEVARDIAELVGSGDRVYLVHGGSAAIDDLSDRLDIPRRRLQAPDGTVTRYTDPATMRAVRLALLGEVKPQLVAALARAGVRALSMSGADANLVRARRKGAVRAVVDGRQVVVRDNLAGRVVEVDGDALDEIGGLGLVPVLSPPALSEDGELVNVDADRLAAGIAASCAADRLVLLTSAPGVLTDPGDPASLVPRLDQADLEVGDGTGVRAEGGMRMKLVAVSEALSGGVSQVHVADGRGPSPVLAALRGAGTVVLPTTTPARRSA